MKWKLAGNPCPVNVASDPRKRTRCGLPVDVETMLSNDVGPANGPQGAWQCPAGHRGWIWRHDCETDEEVAHG